MTNPLNKDKTLPEAAGNIADQLRAEIAERERLISDLDAFSHMVAHDLKSPVTAISGYAFLLSKRLADSDDIHALRFIEIISQTSHRMGMIIDELLLLASVRQQDVILRPVDMECILGVVIERLSYMIHDFQAEITQPTSWPAVLGYDAWVEEIWVNYLSNAIKYGSTPPRLDVGVTIQTNGMARFWVQDNGEGLPPDRLSDLFSPFTRLDQVRISGYGLGLSIVKRIVEKLGGEVDIESSGVPGEGSKFSFTLPLTDPAAKAASENKVPE
jgi:signal transduction histidine kinase